MMALHRIEWKGGPLDGLVDRIEHPIRMWVGPDPVDPKRKIVVYGLFTVSQGGWEYRYLPKDTRVANGEA